MRRPLLAVRRRLDEEPDYLPRMMREYLVENRHRTTVLLRPEPGLNQKQEAAERAELDAVQATLDAEGWRGIVEETHALRERQERPDSPEALALLPSLGWRIWSRTSRRSRLQKARRTAVASSTTTCSPTASSMWTWAWTCNRLRGELLPYAKLFGQCLLQMGTETEDYRQIIAAHRSVDGRHLSRDLCVGDPQRFRHEDDSVAQLFLRGKATAARAGDLLDILRDVLLTVRLDNQERFRQIVLRGKANLESGLVPSGHSVVDGRLRSAYSAAGWASEQMGGISYLQTLRALADEIDSDWPSVLERLKSGRAVSSSIATPCSATSPRTRRPGASSSRN